MDYKILSLDGGGSWSIIQARVLLDIYGDINGHALLRQFDMVIANSGGSLVLACLCHDMKISEIIEVFNQNGKRKKVFSSLTYFENIWYKILRKLLPIGPQYSTTRKLQGIREVLSGYQSANPINHTQKRPIIDQYLDELPKLIGCNENGKDLQIIVAAFDYFRQRVSFFRSNDKSNTDRFSNDPFFRITLGHAVHASSTAPVNYFDNPAEVELCVQTTGKNAPNIHSRPSWYWDGAVAGFNNPVLAGLVEAITNNAVKDDIKILSLGTGISRKACLTGYHHSSDPCARELYNVNKNNPLVNDKPTSSFLSDVIAISKSILSDPPDSATFIAYSFLDPSLDSKKTNLVRINPYIAPVLENGKYEYPKGYNKDDAEHREFLQLMKLPMDATEDEEVALINSLCSKFINDNEAYAVPNQLIRGNAGGKQLGHENYRAAKQRWLEIIASKKEDTTLNQVTTSVPSN